MDGHCNNFRKRVNLDVKTDTFTNHFYEMCRRYYNDFKPKTIKENVNFSILWAGNPISLTKTFGTDKCVLCSKERRLIVENKRIFGNSVINNNSEIYGKCRHNAHFHHFMYNNSEKDTEELACEKAPLEI